MNHPISLDRDLVLPLPNGLKLQLDSPEQRACAKYIAREIFRWQVYHRVGFELRPTDTVVDVGANVGVFCLWAAPQVSHGRVICIEPTPAIDALRQSLGINDLTNVTVVQAAVSDCRQPVELVFYPGFNGCSHSVAFTPSAVGQFMMKWLLPKQPTPTRITAEGKPLAEILAEHDVDKVDFLKVDCEGGEYVLFDSMSDDMLGRISRIAMEFHHFSPEHDVKRIMQRLQTAGFEVQLVQPWYEKWIANTGMLWACAPGSEVLDRQSTTYVRSTGSN
jgi:FkbM family methyltransferase